MSVVTDDGPIQQPEVNEAALKALFKAFDIDGNGKLSKEELAKAFKAWGTAAALPLAQARTLTCACAVRY